MFEKESDNFLEVEAEFPEKLQCFWLPKRYKVAYGGRGSAKSWTIAGMLTIRGSQEKLRILCVRELQKSIEESVHKLISDQIDRLHLNGMYIVEKARIYCPSTGSEFIFEGIRNNVTKIKSYEGIDICWAEEAQAISYESWKVLIPTIRKPGSEIWISFNPKLKTDATYQKYVLKPPTNSFVVEINWRDNKWFPEVLQEEMEELKTADFDSYMNVWEGKCEVVLEGAVYKNQIRTLMLGGQVTRVPYVKGTAVTTYWDIGRGDYCSIWFVQQIGFDFRFIDFYEKRGEDLNHFLEVLQNKRYIYGTHYLPHDARNEVFQHPKSVLAQMRAQGFKAKAVKKLRIAEGIDAARRIMPRCFFDEGATLEGFNHLQNYSYKLIKGTGSYSKEPDHNDHSHAADAFRMFAVSTKEPGVVQEPDDEFEGSSSTLGTAKALIKKLLDLEPSSSDLDWMA